MKKIFLSTLIFSFVAAVMLSMGLVQRAVADEISPKKEQAMMKTEAEKMMPKQAVMKPEGTAIMKADGSMKPEGETMKKPEPMKTQPEMMKKEEATMKPEGKINQ